MSLVPSYYLFLSDIRVLSQHLEGKYDWFSGVRVDVVEGTLYSLYVLTITMFLIHLISNLTEWYGKSIASHTESTFDDELMPALRRGDRVILGDGTKCDVYGIGMRSTNRRRKYSSLSWETRRSILPLSAG